MTEIDEDIRPGDRIVRAPAPGLRRFARWPLALRGLSPAVPSRPARPPAPLSGLDDVETLEEVTRSRVIRWSIILFVVLPTILSGGYLFGFASDQYAAEARFAVRTLAADDRSNADQSLQSILTVAGSVGGQDADIVANYIHSRAIIDDLSKQMDVRAIFQRPEADFLMRLSKDASIEDFVDYWRKMISVNIEATSGIVTLSVRAFRRDDALALTQAILHAGETLVENLSRQVRDDIVRHAEDEVQRSETRVRAALDQLQTYRDTQGLIDPVKSADATAKLVLQLMTDKIQVESQLFVSQRTTGVDAPGVAPLRAKLDSINLQIDRLQQQMAGTKETKPNLAALISQFEELDLKRQFAERLYSLTQEGLTRARLLAERRAAYLAVFVPPAIPEDYSYPLRWTSVFLIGIGAFLAWCCGATIWASVLDHKL